MIASIHRLPRTRLAHLPTPLEPLDRLSEALGGPRIWIKRDDCTGLGTGGNKTRKLEFLLGAAEAADTDVVITFGAVQSNHARQTAAACARRGIECHLFLARKVAWRDPNYESLGNVLLDRMFGAHVHLLDSAKLPGEYRQLKSELESHGHRPYVIPTGGSNGIGALGYALCADELADQAAAEKFELTDVVHATSSAGTQAGLLAGFAMLDRTAIPRVHGINVSETLADVGTLERSIAEIAGDALVLASARTALDKRAIHVDSEYLGDGYGLPTDATLAALHRVAELEGVLLDPVYSGKAMSGLIGKISRGQFNGTANVVFLHTGGTASLPVYGRALTG